MSQILELRNRRATISARVNELAKIEEGGGELSVEQLTELAALEKEFAETGAKIARLEAAQRMAAETALQVDTLRAPQPPPAGSTVPAQPRGEIEFRPHAIGRLIGAIAKYQGMHPLAAAPYAAESYGEDIGAVLAAGNSSGGAVLVPQNLGTEIIELLTPHAVVRQMGAVVMPLPQGGNIELGRNRGGIVGGYTTQTGDKDTDRIKTSTPKFDSLKLKARTFSGLVPINSDFLRNAQNQSVQTLIEGDLGIGMANQEDQQFLRGSEDGGKAPKGMLNWVIPINTFEQTVLPTDRIQLIETIKQDTGRMILALENANSLMRKVGWVMAPRTKRFLMDLVDGNGNKAFPEMEQGLFRGYPYKATTNVPVNLGANGKESELYFTDFGDCYIGEDGAIELSVAAEASYMDGDGNWRSAYQENQILIRAVLRHDFGPRHVESIAVMKKLTWGA